MKSIFFKSINENQEHSLFDNENLTPSIYLSGEGHGSAINELRNNSSITRRNSRNNYKSYDSRYQMSVPKCNTSIGSVTTIKDVTTNYNNQGLVRKTEIGKRLPSSSHFISLPTKKENDFDFSIQNKQLPLLMGNILDLKSQMKQLKAMPSVDGPIRDASNYMIPQSEGTSSHNSIHSREVPNFNYFSELSTKPYIVNPGTGHYYNMNSDYQDNNSDFFSDTNRRIVDFNDFSTTPSIGSPDNSVQEHSRQRSFVIKYLKEKFRSNNLRNNSDYSLASSGSRRRRHRRQLRIYTHRMKKKIKYSISQMRKKR
ncbi:hypothetical protein, no similarity [Maudiozyma saulgeensis]|uniref:Uncharacterized protein n=1 Tax=Maudiozyma saulgeensis TaxID=1789683 RepID=A0A1X7RBJ3_9SACH|nr:hypothetical protein, no similarity [Kazachstania saulgeensis]